MNVFDMAKACEPMEYDTRIVARLPDGTEWSIDRAKWRMNRKRDEGEIVLDLGEPVGGEAK